MTYDLHMPSNDTSQNFVDQALGDSDTPVVLFSLSWCSYCRAIKQFLDSLAINYKEYELDRGEFREPELQQQVRRRLLQLTTSGTLPQLFIGQESLGGYTETISAARSGQLRQVLDRHAIAHAKTGE